MTVRGLRAMPRAGTLMRRGPAMKQRHIIRHTGRASASIFALLCAFALIMPAAAKSSNGTVTIHASIAAKIVVAPGGPTVLIATLQNGANKKEWWYVYAVNGGNAAARGQVTVKSNRSWNGTLTAAQTAGDKKKMDLASGILHYSTALPTTFAQANAAPVVGTTPITLASNHILGVTTYTHYFLLHVSQGSGGTAFSATLTYGAGQVAPVLSATAQVTITFPRL